MWFVTLIVGVGLGYVFRDQIDHQVDKVRKWVKEQLNG